MNLAFLTRGLPFLYKLEGTLSLHQR
jgi:hypothetical protein